MQDNCELMELNERAGRTLTGDDAATVIGICVSLLIMLAGALACIVSFDLLKALVQLSFIHSHLEIHTCLKTIGNCFDHLSPGPLDQGFAAESY